MRLSKKVLLALAGLAALVLLGWWLTRAEPAAPTLASAPEPRPPQALRAPPPEASTRRPGPGRTPQGELVPPITRLPPPRAPIIEEISFDKRSVCFNEDVTVTVRARTPGGQDDAFLRYRVAGEEGPVVSLRRLSLGSSGGLPERGGYTVTVTGREGMHVTAPLPELEVRNCRVPDEFELVHSPQPGTDGLVGLSTSPIGHNPDLDAVLARGKDDAPPFLPVKYVWSFGDGATAETVENSVVHDFGRRPQTTRYSYFLVKCEAVDAQGRTLTASKSIELKNPAFESFMNQGMVRLRSQPWPALVGEDGRVTVPVRLWHAWTSPVTVTAVRMRRHRGMELRHSDERNPPSSPTVEELPASLALGAPSIPLDGLFMNVTFEPERDRDVVAKEVRVEGLTAEGWPLKGHFIATRPGLDPLERRMLVDGEWRAKMLRARAHLDRRDVTAEEVMNLEAQGLFEDLPRAFQGTPPPGFEPPEPQPSEEEW
ncbi:hypothetical protein KYC5002_12595 [Archangium violaceum]|uniref:hypothetical protein n=1 Tax=Archangium violaceum TaxID=83451 RepID=UPI002B2EDAB0|nr:hypothetical protein KYC5002_12595 [Archangium gephyra]